MKREGVQHTAGGKGRFGFRAKLTVAMMLVVLIVTGLAVYLAQRNAQTNSEESLQTEFQARSTFVFGLLDARQTAVSERCKALARSVRIRAALEEDDIDNLYTDAGTEPGLSDVLGGGSTADTGRAAALPRATLFCFLNAAGEILPPPGKELGTGAWQKQLSDAGLGRGSQQIGYEAVEAPDGKTRINEIVSTPMIGADGEMMGALVLGFPPVDSKPGPEIKTGVWAGGVLQMAELPPVERDALSGSIERNLGLQKPADNHFIVQVGGEPNLLFYKILNPGSRFPPAYEICLYSLVGRQWELRLLQWKIVGVGMLVLLIGLAVSHLFSATLSKPVEQLAVDSAQNLARREQVETELEVTEQKYRSIFENAVEGIFLLAPDGKYMSANPAMARIFGCESPAQFVSAMDDPARQLYASPALFEKFLQTARTNGFVSDFETEMRRKDGTGIWVSQNARAVRGPEGELLHFEGTLEDITERKNAADSLRQVNAELEKALADLKTTQQQVIQQERLRALGQMASGIAHDFNNALMPVTGFAELLMVNPAILDDKKKATGYLQIIRTAAQDATNIVARLREFYRANEQSDVFTQVNLSRLAKQSISLTQPKWKNQAQASGAEIYISEMLGEVPPIAGDESAIREVLTNLIFNAVDAMPGGGTITLRTYSEDGRVIMEVSDTGSGMSDQVRERCLEPFFSTKGERGTGLGLAMVFGIVQRHDGKMEIKSELGRGTTFVLSFPVRMVVSKAGDAGPLQHQQGLRVLVVDDEPQVREVMTAFLMNEGHEVQTADDGVDGLRRFLDGKFDLIITDKAMPGMSGDQMAVAIKQLSPKMPIVLLSGFHTARENEELDGIDVIANKPITLPMLRETINKAMHAA